MIKNEIERYFLILLFVMITLSFTACSSLLKSEVLRPEPWNTNWIPVNGSTYYKFESESVCIVVYGITLTQGIAGSGWEVLSLGPPLLPIFPNPRPWPEFYDFVFEFYIDSNASSVSIDFSKILIEFWGKQSIRPTPGEIVFSNQKVRYLLKFDRLPSDVEEIVIDLGTIYVDGKYLRLPPIKYRKISKYHYAPLHFGLQ